RSTPHRGPAGQSPDRRGRSPAWTLLASVEVTLPVPGHPTRRSGHRMVERVVVWRSEHGSLEVLLGGVIPEPVLAGLEALDDRMPGVGGVAARMLRRRRVAAPDMAAVGAAAKMEPPAVRGQALCATGAARRRSEIELRI